MAKKKQQKKKVKQKAKKPQQNPNLDTVAGQMVAGQHDNVETSQEVGDGVEMEDHNENTVEEVLETALNVASELGKEETTAQVGLPLEQVIEPVIEENFIEQQPIPEFPIHIDEPVQQYTEEAQQNFAQDSVDFSEVLMERTHTAVVEEPGLSPIKEYIAEPALEEQELQPETFQNNIEETAQYTQTGNTELEPELATELTQDIRAVQDYVTEQTDIPYLPENEEIIEEVVQPVELQSAEINQKPIFTEEIGKSNEFASISIDNDALGNDSNLAQGETNISHSNENLSEQDIPPSTDLIEHPTQNADLTSENLERDIVNVHSQSSIGVVRVESADEIPASLGDSQFTHETSIKNNEEIITFEENLSENDADNFFTVMAKSQEDELLEPQLSEQLNENDLQKVEPDLHVPEPEPAVVNNDPLSFLIEEDDDFLDDDDDENDKEKEDDTENINEIENHDVDTNNTNITHTNNKNNIDLLSDDDSLISSDEEIELDFQNIAKPLTEETTETTALPSKYIPTANTSTSAITLPVSQKYEPRIKTVKQASITKLEIPGINAAGIVPPKPNFQRDISNDIASNSPSSTVTKKLNDEKKKSDAYDFPMDLVGSTIQKGHAKPVSLPTPQLSDMNSVAIPLNRNPSSNHTINTGSKIHLRTTSKGTIPPNPYAISTQMKAPINQYVPSLDSLNTSAIPQKQPRMYAPNVVNAQAPPVTNIVPKVNVPLIVNPQAPLVANPPQGMYAPQMVNAQASPITSPLQATYAPPFVKSQEPDVVIGKYAPVQNLAPSNNVVNANIHQPQQFTFPAKNDMDNQEKINDLAIPIAGRQTRKKSISRSGADMYNPIKTKGKIRYSLSGRSQSGIQVEENNINMQQSYLPYVPTTQAANATSFSASRYSNEPQLKPEENVALLGRQFPLFKWGPSRKISYGVPPAINQSSYMMNTISNEMTINIIETEEMIKPDQLLNSFIGPLFKGKTKEKDISKWINDITNNIANQFTSDEILVYKLLDLKLSSKRSMKDVAELLYTNRSSLGIVSRTQVNEPFEFNSHKLGANSQKTIADQLQTGQHHEALSFALKEKDSTMALLIASMMGKDRITQVVKQYFTEEYGDSSSGILLSLLFQVFVGNPSDAVASLYNDQLKSSWAINNWQLLVSSILNNIGSTDSNEQVLHNSDLPINVIEFLIEFGIFLNGKQLELASHILFIIVNMPLNSKPITNTSNVVFNYIGTSTTAQSSIWSEIYEFLYSKDPKHRFFYDILPQKLYHATILYESGQVPLATKYADSLLASLKILSKKDPMYINLNAHLQDLNNSMSSSSSWLGKPKFSSVWDQLDKSFNRYIGGDDDSSLHQNGEKKIFDRFTPVNSRNSSTLDLTQPTFTPYQNKLNPISKIESISIGEMVRHGRTSSLKTNVLMNDNYLPHSQSRDVQHEHAAHVSSQNPAQQMKIPNLNNDLSLSKVSNDQSSKSKQVSIDGLNNSPPPKMNSQYDGSERQTPQDIPLKNLDGNASFKPPLNRAYSDTNSSIQSTHSSAHLSTFDVKTAIVTARSESQEAYTKVNQALSDVSKSSTLVLDRNNLDLNGTGMISSIHTSTKYDVIAATSTNTTDELRNVQNPIESSLVNNEMPQNSEIMQGNDKSTISKPILSPPLKQLTPSNNTIENIVPQSVSKPVMANSYIPSNSLVPNSTADTVLAKQNLPSADMNTASFGGYAPTYDHGIKREGNKKFSPIKNDSNTFLKEANNTSNYANFEERKSSAPNPVTVSMESTKKKQYRFTSVSDATITNIDSIPQRIRSRFEPIQESEVLTEALFEPVIKISNNLNFKPRSSIVSEEMPLYEDDVEDESDDEGEQQLPDAKLKEESSRNEAREQSELAEKNFKKVAESENCRDKDQVGSSGWFTWLKKDPNAKKPIKAKLGNKKSNFYYDEELKRWITKNATEEEKQQITAPPPPPPMSKKRT
ncbi:hypothetical protein TPHA_0I01800 [Tetrapisispora phaffii CBS 4417]|uniref:Protein transport protein sec16 n=1 Tax=Tetrapisispora phaffii (strain ATCC 24235 / CBS 4417 / NBRC 1672 / NRRL Y-8282 / UCD 70-5) TaxID=1071381 RepID=G8BXQ6_TETPH|nr:hypothetical protein TPHA_0I01800 [Tetrapisispora phaffii CBS 4417]CCE64684.1 hypothetical protein TPHA_0I01800 [Tetrapisispora phaffii CBS 4417]